MNVKITNKKDVIFLALALSAAMHNVHASSPTGGPALRSPAELKRSTGGVGCGDLAATFNSTPPIFYTNSQFAAAIY